MEQKKIKVKILEGGVTAKEVNRFQKLKYKEYFAEMSPIIGKKAAIEMYHRNNYNWDEAEQKLRTFTIAEVVVFGQIANFPNENLSLIREEYTAEVLDEEKLIIRIV